jgi:hypothetical protein
MPGIPLEFDLELSYNSYIFYDVEFGLWFGVERFAIPSVAM